MKTPQQIADELRRVLMLDDGGAFTKFDAAVSRLLSERDAEVRREERRVVVSEIDAEADLLERQSGRGEHDTWNTVRHFRALSLRLSRPLPYEEFDPARKETHHGR